MTKIQSLAVALAALACCRSDRATEQTSFTNHAVAVDQLKMWWIDEITWGGSGVSGYLGPIETTADRNLAVQHAFERRDDWCNAIKSEPCLQGAVVGLRVQLCPVDHGCGAEVFKDTGWVALMSRYASEENALIAFLESQSYPVESFRETLRIIKTAQEGRKFVMDAEVDSKLTVAQFASTAHDRIAAMAGPVRSAEQLHLANTRRVVSTLEEITARYQTDLDAVQAAYGDIAARHAAYRATETDAFGAITQVATDASTAELPALATLKVMLGTQSDSENRTPQLLIVDAKRVLWDLTRAQATYETALAPYTQYLVEHSWRVLDHTSAPKTGMNNVVAYAERRMQRANDGIKTIYEGIRRREAALSAAAADAATRDQLRAADAAEREAEFLNDVTARVSAIWASPPIGALNLPLQGERMSLMTTFLQLEAVCTDVAQAATWRAPGCQKVKAEAGKIRTYLNQTLPVTVKFGVQKMRSAGFNADLLSDIEAKVTAGSVKQAVQLYDAAARSGGEI